FTSAVLPDYNNGGRWGTTYLPGAWPDGEPAFIRAQPGLYSFCVPTLNFCDQKVSHQSNDPRFKNEPPGPCTKDDLTMCWWHSSATWTNCRANCGRETLRYTTVDPRPLANNIHPEQCALDTALAGALIVDDIATSAPLGPDGCAPVASGGKFALKFASTTT